MINHSDKVTKVGRSQNSGVATLKVLTTSRRVCVLPERITDGSKPRFVIRDTKRLWSALDTAELGETLRDLFPPSGNLVHRYSVIDENSEE
jgi:hypothetical protein